VAAVAMVVGQVVLVVEMGEVGEVVQVAVMVMGEDLVVQARGGAGTRKEDGWGGEQLQEMTMGIQKSLAVMLQ
jgi:hypothetical protein